MFRNRSHQSTPIIPLALLALLTPAALAQGSRADYDRAAKLPEIIRGKVCNESLQLIWLSDHGALYRRQTTTEQWSYVSVDTRGGLKQPAFKHEPIARQLGEILGEPIDPAQLPFERFALIDDVLHVLLKNRPRVFRIDPTGEQIREVPLENITEFRLEPTSIRRSHDEGGDTAVIFINHADSPVQLIWLDRDGNRRPYATLEPDKTSRQHTFAGHVWLVLGQDDAELGLFKAGPRPSIALIENTPQIAEPEPETPSRSTSPDGRWEAFIKDHNVHLRDLESKQETALSTDGTEEDWYTQQIHWSPDSKYLAVVRTDREQTHTIHMVESAPADQVQPKLHSMQYLKPGDRIAHPRPCLFEIEQRRQIPIADELFDNPWSISKFHWLPDSSELTFVYNQRGHQILRLIGVAAETGAARVIIDEKADTFIDYAGKLFLHQIDKTAEAIWMSERDGWNHLYLYDTTSGEVKNQITRGDWAVRGIESVDDELRQIWFRAKGAYPGQDPYHVHYGRVNFDGSGLTWLTEGDGTHNISFSPDREYYVDTYSRVDLPPVHELRRSSDGSLMVQLERADWSALLETGWRPPERFVAKGRDGLTDIWGVLFYPTTLDRDGSYPVLENIYAGPHDHFVPKRFSAWHASRALAELGFVVVRIDGMGTNWRSRAFHDVCWKNLGDSGFPDRIRWTTAAAAERPFMDITRVGIFGGSAGGQSALRALLAHGDFYKAAVADCGCHDNRMDKIWWNELWMGWPIGPHYEEQSNVTQAHNLSGHLLLTVGELDRNVDPASTMQVVAALVKADKDFDLLVMPGAGHGAGDSSPYAKRRRADFFVRHLLGKEPRWEVDQP